MEAVSLALVNHPRPLALATVCPGTAPVNAGGNWLIKWWRLRGVMGIMGWWSGNCFILNHGITSRSYSPAPPPPWPRLAHYLMIKPIFCLLEPGWYISPFWERGRTFALLKIESLPFCQSKTKRKEKVFSFMYVHVMRQTNTMSATPIDQPAWHLMRE